MRKHQTLKKKLIKLRGHRCQVESCEYRSSLDLHHIIAVAEGGEDSEDNAILLCPNHHRDAHTGELTIEDLYEMNGYLEDL